MRWSAHNQPPNKCYCIFVMGGAEGPITFGGQSQDQEQIIMGTHRHTGIVTQTNRQEAKDSHMVAKGADRRLVLT